MERLSDSCILQLVKTSFATFLVDNIQLLQLKSINLICGVIYALSSGSSYILIFNIICILFYNFCDPFFLSLSWYRYLLHILSTEAS